MAGSDVPDRSTVLARGKSVVGTERDALAALEARLDDTFVEAVELLYGCSGKAVLTGAGKSGIIARKITATLNSTGTPAIYLHPNDALHGDLGILLPGDVLIVLSKSGATRELEHLLRATAALSVPVIALTGNPSSRLARQADVVLDCSVEREACLYDLAPTASTTTMLALGDALAVALYERKGFSLEEFATTHPGGALGRRLLLKLADLMKTGEAVPIVEPDAPFDVVILEMSRKRIGATLVAHGERLVGIVTDGDLRRLLGRDLDIRTLSAAEMMTASPMSASPDLLCSVALVMLEEKKRTHLPVVDTNGAILGIVHMHDLIEAGIEA